MIDARFSYLGFNFLEEDWACNLSNSPYPHNRINGKPKNPIKKQIKEGNKFTLQILVALISKTSYNAQGQNDSIWNNLKNVLPRHKNDTGLL